VKRAAILAALALAALPSPARADPSVWARAREPALEERRELAQKVDALLGRYRRAARVSGDATLPKVYLEEARALLERGGAATSPDPGLRFRLAEIASSLHEMPLALGLYESVVRTDAPAPMRAQAWAELAILYVKAGRHHDEIRAYGEALALEPGSLSRARLLSNRAEAYMAIGDLDSSIAGYRASLAALGTAPYDMLRAGVTTLWGLAVALDRSGDLDQALRQITLARTYDFADRALSDPSWFFVPPWDDAWYAALGHWATARTAELSAVRVDAYGRAAARLRDYLARAPADDRWAPIAKHRLAQCERERQAYVKTLKLAPAPRDARPRPPRDR
jgi:tetratricopeptide (TPR) repeat protein